jgi:hypothetical protein
MIQLLKAKKLATSSQAAMCKAFSLSWVPSMEALLSCACMNHSVSADSIFSSGKHFNDFHCLEKCPHWQNLFYFVHTPSQQHLAWTLKASGVMPVKHMCQYVHQFALKYLFYHFLGDLYFPLSSVFHHLAVKFVLITCISHLVCIFRLNHL